MTAPGGTGLPATVNQFHQFEPRMGSEYVMAAFSMPGTALSRSTASAKERLLSRVRPGRPGQREHDGLQVARIETRIDARQSQHRVDHQSGSGEQHRRDRHFANQQAAAQERVLPSRAAARPHHRLMAGARRPQCGKHAEEERAGTAEECGDGQHDGVEADLVEPRSIRGRDADEAGEDRGARKCTEHATGPNQQRVFDEKLTDQAPPAAADRRADAELVRARCAPVQQQAGQVDAGDEQEQRDCAGEHSDGLRHIPDHALGEGDDGDAAALVGLRMFQRKRGHDILHFRARRGHVDAALEPADAIQACVAAAALHRAIVRRYLRLEQQIHIGGRHVAKACRQDADHGI